jgi:hypothetical protein
VGAALALVGRRARTKYRRKVGFSRVAHRSQAWTSQRYHLPVRAATELVLLFHELTLQERASALARAHGYLPTATET